jgi:decaprenylphospho-beta-D-ribofuranose 2-oxidase
MSPPALPEPVPEAVTGFGHYNFSVSPVYRPASVEELRALLAPMRARGERPVFRGAGRSYGDASLHPGGPIVDLSRLRAIKGFDQAAGVVSLEPGVTYEDLWRFSVPRGFWPPVVPGTMMTTLGGSVAMNVHGKNNWAQGPLGEHVERLAVLRTSGAVEWIEKLDPELLDVVSGWGRPEPIVEIALHLKKVETGYLDVEVLPTKNLGEMLDLIDASKDKREYVVAWMDCFASGRALGRGVLHLAHPRARRPGEPLGLSVAEQLADIPVGRSLPVPLLLAGLRAMTFDGGMRLVNAAKYFAARRAAYRQSLVAFSFLLDYLPGWNSVYLPGGFIQYQLFIPKERAHAVFEKAVSLQHEAGVVSYLGVVKRHRPDRFRATHAVDGFSLALDFPVTSRNASRLIGLCRAYDRLVLENGGRLYKAKDCVGSVERLEGLRKAAA